MRKLKSSAVRSEGGETSQPSVYFTSVKKEERDDVTGEDTVRTIRFMRSYSVFNCEQIDGLPLHFYPDDRDKAPLAPSAKREAIAAFFEPIPIDVRHGGDRAFYAPGADYVQLPQKTAFVSEDHYAATLGHELGHATGHPDRLDRTFGKRFGDKACAFEELVAEITSGRICYELELPSELHDSHASYVDHWLQILKADKSAIITAAAKSEQAFAWLAAHSGYGEQADDAEVAAQTPPTEKLAA